MNKLGVNKGEGSKLQGKAGSDTRFAILNGISDECMENNSSRNVEKSGVNEGFKVDSVTSLISSLKFRLRQLSFTLKKKIKTKMVLH